MQQIWREKNCGNRHDWVGKWVEWELCNRLHFEYTDKWYTHRHRKKWNIFSLLDFAIQKKKNRTCKRVDFAIPVSHRERKWNDGEVFRACQGAEEVVRCERARHYRSVWNCRGKRLKGQSIRRKVRTTQITALNRKKKKVLRKVRVCWRVCCLNSGVSH